MTNASTTLISLVAIATFVLAIGSTAQFIEAKTVEDITLDIVNDINKVYTVSAQEETSPIIVLSHRFDTNGLPSVIGEVQNNNTRGYDKFDVDIKVNFRDAFGTLITSEDGYIDAERLNPGDSSAFEATSFDETLPDIATTYDIIVDDNRVVEGASINGDSDNSNEDSNDNEEEDDDN